jgi:iron complex outermembrane receptor protein
MSTTIRAGTGVSRSAILRQLACNVAIASIAAAMLATSSQAQSAASDSSDAATRSSDKVQDIVVTAGKREQLLSSVGGGISAITSEQIDIRGANSLADYMALVPGVNLQSLGSPGFGWVEIRGISPQSVGATVATYIDDIPFGGSSALSRGGEYTPDLDPSDLQRVEVLKGPQGTLYGASSLGGVIKYVTKEPSLTKTEINATEDMNFLPNGEAGGKVRASVSTPLVDDKLSIRVSGYYRRDPGFINVLGLGGSDENHSREYGFRGTILYKPTDHLTVNLNAMLQRSDADGFDNVDLDPATFKPLFGKYKIERYTPEGFKVKTDLYSAEVKWDTNLGSLISASSYSYLKPQEVTDITSYYSSYYSFISPQAPAAAVGTHSDKQETEELRFTSKRFGPLEFIAGGFYQHEKLFDNENYTSFTPGGQIDPNVPLLGVGRRTGTLSEYAGFVNATVYLTSRLDVTGGYRHSEIDQTRSLYSTGVLYGATTTSSQTFSENSNTYLAGLRWRMTDDVMLYGRAASGYRPGGGRSVPPGAPANFGLTFSPDSIWSYEAGVKARTLNGRLTIDADAFWIAWSNIQTLVYVGRYNTDGNGGKARSRGAEVQLAYVPVRGLTLGGNAAYTDAQFTQDSVATGIIAGTPIYFVPKWTGTLTADYSWTVNERVKADIGGDYEYRSSQKDISHITLPGYALFNLHAGVQLAHYSVNLYVKNLTNKYAIIGDQGYVADSPPYTVTINTPRTIGISFSQKF